MGSSQDGGRGVGWALVAIVGVLVVIFAAMALGSYYYSGYPMMMYTYHPFWVFFPIGFILFFFLAFVLVRALFWPWGWGMRRRHWYYHDEALDILRQRYARGEISKEQYDQMSRDLEQRSSRSSP